LSNCNDSEIRREWILRILDHDGFELNGIKDEGGIEAWIQLGQAVGLSRDDVVSLRYVAPASRFAVDAYVNFARRHSWQEAVASSLTELFAPHIHQQRIDTWPEQYPWVDAVALKYFKNRLTQARRDVAHGLSFTLNYFSQTRALQERALEILQFKLDVLWSLADAIMLDQCKVQITGPKK
jgi:pyrroloquinoline-quinone synthase